MKANSGKKRKGQAHFACGKGAAPSRGTRRAQVSAELIILIAAVLSVALILVVQMQNTAKEGKKTLQENSKKVFKEIDDTAKLATGGGSTPEPKGAGESCTADSQCSSGYCVAGACE